VCKKTKEDKIDKKIDKVTRSRRIAGFKEGKTTVI